ncbi:LysM domain protein [Cordyceps militaris]|uniref:LysM domain protein n=1 Tax=Cordyceps militaris TaxID=73501 RepID=A0A2H4SLN4_CORMI|nr:LysM domain protein [Cordyceps militaris]
MTVFWYAAAVLSALAALHRLFKLHAVHSLFLSCATRTDTRCQTRFENLEHFYTPRGDAARYKWPTLVTYEFEADGDSILIEVPAGSFWGLPAVRHHTQEMCREVYMVSGNWAIGQFMGGGPVRGPPELPNLFQRIVIRYAPAQRPSQIRRFGSKKARQLDHMIVSAVQDARVYFKLCSTPLWLRLVYAALSALSPHAADTLARRILWVQIRTMFFCHDTWEFRGTCMIFRIFWPFFNEPDWVRKFEDWSEGYKSRQFLRLNYWLGLAKPTTSPLSMLEIDFIKPTKEQMTEIHDKFILSLNTTEASFPPRPPPPPLPHTISLANASSADLSQARARVDRAIKQQDEYNIWRLANPKRGKKLDPSTARVQRDTAKQPFPPRLTPELLKAVKLTNDVDTQDLHNNGTLQRYQSEAKIYIQDLRPPAGSSARPTSLKRVTGWDGSDWMADQDHSLSQQPFHSEKDYKVWRNVKDYGAVGDGVTDDTDAIQKAISDGKRCGKGCPESSVSGAIVYFPSGTYRVDRSIVLYYNTQLVGGVKGAIPTIQSARNFIGLGVFTTDVYLPDGHSEWYLNTVSRTCKGMVGIHWQVAQATTIEETSVMMSNASSTTQVGIFAENGSGGWMGDITISNGEYGILAGSQQYSASRITIIGSQKCIGLIWNWVWSWSHLRLEGCKVGIDLTAGGSDSKSPVGSLSVVDSSIIHCDTAIKAHPFTLTQAKEQGSTIITLSHSQIYGSTTFIGFPDGASISKRVDDWKIDYWQFGNDFRQGDVAHGESTPKEDRPASLLDSNGNWFSTGYDWMLPRALRRRIRLTSGSSKPIFYNRNKDQVINARLHAAAGVYLISSPLLIPPNSRIRGEVWSQLMAVGDRFSDAQHPTAMITVGQGEKDGLVQMENLLFTSRGALPGLALLQWNIQTSKPGNVGMWDCHFRVGGAVGTDLRKTDCPKLSGNVNKKCIAGAIMFVKTDKGSGYFENMWAWVADHDLDDAAGDNSNQINVYFGRGILIFGDGPTWWRGTASEHSAMYQYNIVSASNVYMSIIQTESPSPFKVDNWIGEPLFDTCGSATTNCNVAWALLIQASDGIYIDGTGLYSWFQNYNQDCVGKKNCQQRLVNIFNSANVFISHLITIGSVEVVTPAISNYYNRIIYVDDALEASAYPWWTAVASYLDSSDKINITSGAYPIKKGWVSFGDSYAAGIGAGFPLDTESKCSRGRGGHPAILNQIIRQSHQVSPSWQVYACSGETAAQFHAKEGVNQLGRWVPDTSDVATVSFTGNDFGFGDIVSHCIMGYPRGSQNQKCAMDRALTTAKLNADGKVTELVHDILDDIFRKKGDNGRFMVYWTGYPQFFDSSDHAFSTQLNGLIKFAIHTYNYHLPFPRAKFVDLDTNSNIYARRRFCEPGATEPRSTHDSQNAVAVFYPNGWDDIPSASESFYMPPKEDGDAPDSWSISVQSSMCSESEDANEPLRPMLCAAARQVANGTLTISDIEKTGDVGAGAGAAVKNSDGSVTITAYSVAYLKMFHPKTRANLHIAQAVHDALIFN